VTTQSSERLESEYPFLDLGVWRVFGVIRGEPCRENHGWGEQGPAYHATPGEARWVTTANWKGYTEIWRLTCDGRLELVAFEYDDPARSERHRDVNETLEGDFYLVLKSVFQGPRLYLPFRNGVLVVDRRTWKHEAYFDNSPVAMELRSGVHPDFPDAARLWYE